MLKIITYDNREMYMSRYSLFYLALGIIVIIFSVFLAIKIITVHPNEFSTYFIALLIILFLLFGGVFLILMVRNHKLIFDNENIIIYDFFGNEWKAKWNEIVSLKTNAISGFVSIIDSNNNKIRLHQFLINYTLFINTLEQKTRWTIKDLKLPIT